MQGHEDVGGGDDFEQGEGAAERGAFDAGGAKVEGASRRRDHGGSEEGLLSVR